MSEVVGYCVVYGDRLPICEQTGELWLWAVLGLVLVEFVLALGYVLGRSSVRARGTGRV